MYISCYSYWRDQYYKLKRSEEESSEGKGSYNGDRFRIGPAYTRGRSFGSRRGSGSGKDSGFGRSSGSGREGGHGIDVRSTWNRGKEKKIAIIKM